MCTMNLVVWVQVLWIFVFTASIMTMTSLITIGHVVISVRLGISPLFKYNITQNAYICVFSCVGFRVLSQIACSWLYEVAMITVYCFFFSPECDIMCNLKLLLSAIFWSHQMHLRGAPHDQLSRQIREKSDLGHLLDHLVSLLVANLMHLCVRHHLNDIHHLRSNLNLHHCQHNHQLRPSMSATMLATLSSSMLATMSATLSSSMSATTT